MLKHLQIQNIALIEEASISFKNGLNILSGETGSGKSAIMQSIALCLGERADIQLVRQGCEKGHVEALFEPSSQEVFAFLYNGGIEIEEGSSLIIKREITSSGKNRIFINNQSASLSFLRKLGDLLVKIVGQGQSHALYSLENHRAFVDLFGNLKPLLSQFQSCFDQENTLREELKKMTDASVTRLRETDTLLKELQEIEEAQLKEGEEEELFQEFTLLSHAEEISRKIEEVLQSLHSDNSSVLSMLRSQKQSLESILSLDPSLQETCTTYHNTYCELQEIAHTLNNYRNRLHVNEERLSALDERLALINKLKRKFGPSIDDVIRYRENARARLDKWVNYEAELEALVSALKMQEAKSHECAQQLSERRRHFAHQFSKAITSHLKELNMSKAEFFTEINSQKRTREGDDRVEFFLLPNSGERCIPIRDGVSGGEISRVHLSLQTLLAGKENQATLIFDEIDANVGGETATLIGRKLNEMSQNQQVICITHFPQVAIQAHHHLQVSKEEKKGRTFTRVTTLDKKTQSTELNRMSGWLNFTSSLKKTVD